MLATDDAGDHAPDGELLAVPEFDRRVGWVFGYQPYLAPALIQTLDGELADDHGNDRA